MDAWMRKHGSDSGGRPAHNTSRRSRARGANRPSGPPEPAAAPAAAPAPSAPTDKPKEGFLSRLWESLKKLGSANLALLAAAVLAAIGGTVYFLWKKKSSIEAPTEPEPEKPRRHKHRRERERTEQPVQPVQASVGPPPEGFAIVEPDPYDDGEELPPLDP